MQIEPAPQLPQDERSTRLRALLSPCVHCGFCTAVCPTYQLLGDERDSPRGRIYLVGQMLARGTGGASTRVHLDRCLLCRACEAHCPSGVRYGELLELGRELAAEHAPEPAPRRLLRALMLRALRARAFGAAVALARALAPLLPRRLARRIPGAVGGSGISALRSVPVPSDPPTVRGARGRVLLLEGCVQPALRPAIHAATVRVLRRAGWEPVTAPGARCCGAMGAHGGDAQGGLADLQASIDAWWPLLTGADGGPPVEAIVMTASGCGTMVREAGARLAQDPAYAERARIVSERTRDLSDLIPELVLALAPGAAAGIPAGEDGTAPARRRVAVHLPCSLQHAQRAGRGIAPGLRELGFDALEAPREPHLCCGSAGTWSLLHPRMAADLRGRKLASLGSVGPECIVSANIGCITHLQAGTDLPVRHWIELVDEWAAQAG